MMAMESTSASDHVLRTLGHLKKALIDTSSILYMQKAGYFDELGRAIQLYSIPEVVSEIKSQVSRLTLIRMPELQSSFSTDRKLIACALENKLTMISEDKRILTAMRHAKAPYYNALMMLNYLLMTHRIEDNGYRCYFSELKKIARYDEAVWKYGGQIYTAVKSKLNAETHF